MKVIKKQRNVKIEGNEREYKKEDKYNKRDKIKFISFEKIGNSWKIIGLS